MIPERQSIVSNTKIQLDKFLPDILSATLYAFFLDKMINWQYAHPAMSCTLLMLLNIIAVSFGCLTFFNMYADNKQLTDYKNSLTSFESSAIGLSVFISIFGFLWWLVPFAGAKQLGVKDTGFILGMAAYFLAFVAVVASSISNKKQLITAASPLVKAANVIFTTLFFFFSYAFLLMSFQYWQPSFAGADLLGLICLIVFYLPLRFFLLLKPPRSKFEYVSFLFSFIYMLYILFARV